MTLTATHAGDVPAGTTAPDWSAFATQIQRENAELLFPLLDRMEEIARRLNRTERVEPDYIEALVRLWSTFVEGFHRRRIMVLGDLIAPMGRVPPAPPHGFRLRGRQGHPDLESTEEGRPPDTPQGQYDRIARDQERTAQRIGVIRSLIRDYRHEQYMSRQLLASLLRSSAFADRAWARYEESFARQNAGSSGSGATSSVPAGSETELERLGAEVRAFLARPIPSSAPATKS